MISQTAPSLAIMAVLLIEIRSYCARAIIFDETVPQALLLRALFVSNLKAAPGLNLGDSIVC